jgi:plastocyanin
VRRAAAAAFFAAACGLGAARGAVADPAGELRGRVSLGVAGVPLAAVAPIVVYLEPEGDVGAGSGGAQRTVRMRQKDAHFAPSFLVIAAGSTVEMANDDAIYHNVFSYSRPNDFDLGLYPAGESRKLVLRHPGVVKLYCSIHESMNATILVTPTRWFDVVDANGGYALKDVRPGRYRAVVWAERLPATTRMIEIGAGESEVLDWVVGSASS